MPLRMYFAVLCGLLCLPSVSAADPVLIHLLGKAEVSGKVAKVADIAKVTGGNLVTRRKIAALDIASMETQSRKRITKQQVQLRIQLAGIKPKDFRALGADSLTLTPIEAESPEKRVLSLLRPEIASRLGVNVEDLKLELAKPIPANARQYFATTHTLEHSLPNEIRIGNSTTQIRIRRDDRLIRTLPISLKVQVYRSVYVAKRQLEPGVLISENDVGIERRLVFDAKQLMTESVVGKKTKTMIDSGQMFSDRNLARAGRAKREIVIRSRDIIEIVARKSALQAKISGAIALQQGAIGDNIRVKNPSSGKVLTAKVVSAGLVEVRL